ncbi:NYN domain-containing protein [Helicobacter pylori]
MEKTETTIFVDWENLLTDLRAIQKNPKTDKRFKEPDFSFNNPEQLLALIRSFLEPEEELKRIYFYVSEPFTEVEPRIKGNKNKELEEYKDKNPKDYEKRVNKSGIIQAFNHEIAQQNQVKLRVGRVKYKFKDISEVERYFSMDLRTNQESLDLRQKGIDTLLAHGIAKLCYTATLRCVFLSSKDTDFAPVLEAAWEKGFEVFIANIQEDPNLVPPDLRKSCGVRERSVAEILAKLPKVTTTSNTPKKENSNEPFNNPFKDLHKKN